MKKNKKAENEIDEAVKELNNRIQLLKEKEVSLAPQNAGFDRTRMEDLLKRRFYFGNSFPNYGVINMGQYDLGPMGCAMKNNILNLWRNHFILEEQMLEVDCTILTPEPVLKASGHVERFADLMVKDVKTGECFRLDHLIKAHLQKLIKDKNTSEDKKKEYEDVIIKLDGFTKDEINAILKKYDIKSPTTNNDLTEAIEFNLMFSTSIGPTGNLKGFLRPETAQGIFVNFKRLLEFNQGKLPFAAAQVGQAFRNEISPRSGLIRVREFTLAEIEHFVDPTNKNHPKFDSIKDQIVTLYSACNQMDGKEAEQITIGEAVRSGTIANESLGYFMARIYSFLLKVGFDPKRLRFRQHMSNEMAHYACDCWDAEGLISYGWLECVGCADRSCFDLTQHTNATGTKLAAEKKLPEPRIEDVIECIPQKSLIGKAFKTDSKIICDTLKDLDASTVNKYEEELNNKGEISLNINGKEYKLNKDMVSVKKSQRKVHVEDVIPGVIEPSFGIGRIMYIIWEHNFQMRKGDEMRSYFSLPPSIAPVKCSILPLIHREEFVPFINKISSLLAQYDVSYKVDDNRGSIGKRYARTDEISIPFGVTIDFDTLNEPHTVTLRERDSMEQIRVLVS